MNLAEQLQEIIREYDTVVKVVEHDALTATDRAYGGVVRAVKGKLQEYISESLSKIAWQFVGGDPDSLEINSKKIRIPIQPQYIKRIKERKVRKHIQDNIVDYFYRLSVDKHVLIDDKFVIGIECKTFTENAMIKRILVDFDLLKSQYPDLSCYLFQLESQLGGDYSTLQKPTYGSSSTHTIQSYFSCDLNIITLLADERKVDLPIHRFFKPLTLAALQNTIDILAKDMKRFVK